MEKQEYIRDSSAKIPAKFIKFVSIILIYYEAVKTEFQASSSSCFLLLQYFPLFLLVKNLSLFLNFLIKKIAGATKLNIRTATARVVTFLQHQRY